MDIIEFEFLMSMTYHIENKIINNINIKWYSSCTHIFRIVKCTKHITLQKWNGPLISQKRANKVIYIK